MAIASSSGTRLAAGAALGYELRRMMTRFYFSTKLKTLPKRLEAITTDDVEALWDARKVAGLSPVTVNQDLRLLR